MVINPVSVVNTNAAVSFFYMLFDCLSHKSDECHLYFNLTERNREVEKQYPEKADNPCHVCVYLCTTFHLPLRVCLHSDYFLFYAFKESALQDFSCKARLNNLLHTAAEKQHM